MTLERIAWSVVVAACALTALLLAIGGYMGYAGITTAVGLSAAINLR
ncbi:hypothetical protein PAI11_02800 [Patulibacter medicamentivorans]|uniref:Uncharacterized protein n=1 Tax=Patulibacter medicamentivorans TaxID=1097667 RepID=H0E0H2_9ACTN|nr:hypothetical protein [Patulibacter medicamentivorans]EHN12833.1 hypothetical protein PAI11_02800 [Patulibacter medicamentivorans]